MNVSPQLKKILVKNHKKNKHLLPEYLRSSMLGFMLKGKFCGSNTVESYLKTFDKGQLYGMFNDSERDDIHRYVCGTMPRGMYQTEDNVTYHMEEEH